MNKKVFSIKLAVLYFIMLSGGLWNMIGRYEQIMQILAGPIMIGISLWAFLEAFSISEKKKSLSVFFIGLIVVTWIIEYYGQAVGIPFGEYKYSGVLQPQIMSTPVAIGFAWWTALASSFAAVEIIWKFSEMKDNLYYKALAVGCLMGVFDLVLEEAAINLNYWSWTLGRIPLQNYYSWMLIGAVAAFAGLKLGVLKKAPPIFIHIFAAQLIYFFMSK